MECAESISVRHLLIWKSWKLLSKNPAGLLKLHLSLKAVSISVQSTHTLEASENNSTFDRMGDWSYEHGVCYTMLELLPTLMSNFNVDSFKKLNMNVDPFIPALKGGSELFYRISSWTERLYLIMYKKVKIVPHWLSWNVFIYHLFRKKIEK